jgi:uncharacterized protein with HXXEE motif
MNRFQLTFGALVLAQVAHSIEEYVSRLWESFPPALLLAGLISPDLRKNFLLLNILFVGFGVWCYVWPVRRQWKAAIGLAWLWAGIELVNGIGHSLWSLWRFGYSPGVITAPLLVILALYMMAQLRSAKRANIQMEPTRAGS